MDAGPTSRCWWDLHAATLVLCAITAAGLALSQFLGVHSGQYFYLSGNEYGWPFVSHDDYGYLNPVGDRTPLVINRIVWVTLVVAVAIVYERWIRSPKRWQFSLAGIMELTAAIAITATIFTYRRTFAASGRLPTLIISQLFCDPQYTAVWFALPVIGGGVVSAVYLVNHVVIHGVRRLVSFLREPRTPPAFRVLRRFRR